MNSYKLKISSITDQKVIQILAKIKSEFNFQIGNASLVFGISFQIPNEGNIGKWSENDVVAKVFTENGKKIIAATIALDGLSLNYQRGAESSSLYFDQLNLTYNGQGSPSEDIRLAVMKRVEEEFHTLDNLPLNNGFDENDALLSLHRERLSRLSDLSEELLRKTSETYGQLETDFKNRRQENDQELLRKKAELELDYAAKKDALKEEELALEEKKKALDDKDNTHARRELRNRMLEDVKDRISKFGVSEKTEKKRVPVRYAIIFLCVVLFVLTLFTVIEVQSQQQNFSVISKTLKAASEVKQTSSNDITKIFDRNSLDALANSNSTMLYALWIRLSLLSVATVAALLYYIRWENRWAEQHSTTEFQLQQFYIDVNRANWVIESGLEWRKEGNDEMPTVMLESLTKNLFRSQDEPPPALHPADELASALLGSASKLKLKNGENEIEFDNPKKIAKE